MSEAAPQADPATPPPQQQQSDSSDGLSHGNGSDSPKAESRPPALPPRPPNLAVPATSSRPSSSTGSESRIANSYTRSARLENEGKIITKNERWGRA